MDILRIAAILSLAAPVASADVALSFNSDIRPLLSDRCFACHGFDAKARKADLRLDTPEGAFEKLDAGQPIVPGDPGASLVWQRIISTDLDEVMPPADSHLKLDAAEKALIRRWIEQGAKYEKHWTFVRAERPTIPAGETHPIDALVANRLRKEGLDFSAEAPKRTLIRRLSFDLRGLPPSPGEVATFLADPSPDAYPKLVDRFLDDPAYGERMAWPWLDAARYADSNGFQGDNERTMWPWRDWVIDAFNKNLPYDQFTVWQIAGDLLPDATEDQILATGFLRNHPINGEGGSIPEENRVNYVMDMAETTGTVWMGLTMNCCRCHDHKYDPLKQSDYYSLFAFFNQTPVTGGGGDPQTPPILKIQDDKKRRLEDRLAKNIGQSKKQLEAKAAALAPNQADWEDQRIADLCDHSWQPLKFEKTSGVTQMELPDGSLLVVGDPPVNATFRLSTTIPAGRYTAIKIDALRHPRMTDGGLAPSDSGNFVLTRFEARSIDREKKVHALDFSRAEATFEQPGFPIAAALDDNPRSGWAVYNGHPIDRDHSAIFHLKEAFEITEDTKIEIILHHGSAHRKHIIGRLQISLSSEDNPVIPADSLPLAQALRQPVPNRSKETQELIRNAYLESDADYTRIRQKLAASESALRKHRSTIPKVMVMGDRKELRSTHVLAVGNYEKPLAEVVANTPEVLPPLPPIDRTANRLDLANWLVDRDHPLTARVTINRLWQDYFGIGLIKTPEDFGVQSEVPIHPDLIDFLAVDFMESGWDLKKLVRTIVTSRTYRQSSRVTPEMLEKDPANRLLARGPRYRLPSWMIRDQALAASGRLVKAIGGPPVKPYQPDGLWSEATFGKKKYIQDSGDSLYRRSIYTFWRRISAPPMFFDNAKRELCSVNPSLTNTPMHALATLNDTTYVEAARLLATRALAEASAPLPYAFEVVHSRPPSADESEVLEKSYQSAGEIFSTDTESLNRFLSIGESPPASGIDPLELGALSSVCLSLLNTDEALSKE